MPPKRGGGKNKEAKQTGKRTNKVWIGYEVQGCDNEGSKLKSLQEWWQSFEQKMLAQAKAGESSSEAAETSDEKMKEESSEKPKDACYYWYNASLEHWKGVPATLDGVLGGFSCISDRDVIASLMFIKPFLDGTNNFNIKINPTRAIDMGAGIGRVAKTLLAKIYKTVDLVEPNPVYLEKAKQELQQLKSVDSTLESPLGNCYCTSLQDFEFEPGIKYDTIWLQWVLLYILDVHLVSLLKKCKSALAPHGVIIIKENTNPNGYYIDNEDCSITRTNAHFKQIFAASGLKLLKEEEQSFPTETQLLPIRMYALI